MMGAYTAASATEFNLLKKARVVVLNDGTFETVQAAPLKADKDSLSDRPADRCH
jgi:hypothetical protein